LPSATKFILKGAYKSSGGSEIALNAMNIPQGSVKVTSGGMELTEGQDFYSRLYDGTGNYSESIAIKFGKSDKSYTREQFVV
jgi:hypothetical protein